MLLQFPVSQEVLVRRCLWWPPSPSPSPVQVAAFQRPEPAGRRRQTADIVCAVEFEEHGWLLATAGVAKQVGG